MIGHIIKLVFTCLKIAELQSGGEFCRHITTPKKKKRKESENI